ncbi:hypothetical protein [Azospirillum canadense]|uniref:hypothetical protein n=1 Tax=Azospirillum canadense TaxID=403962 RepID=UPI0022278F84|nr:hypothetical protein [Azospirillum canadense]MCW2239210.1 hypothetical protein [Azospirillum canadense]
MRNRDLIGKPDWTPATYEAVAADRIAPNQVIVIMITGEVRGAFGIDPRTADDGMPVWIITHLATGHRLPREFLSRDAAVACAQTLEGLACWTMDDPGQMLSHPDARLARRLVASAPGSRADRAEPSGNVFRSGVEPS